MKIHQYYVYILTNKANAVLYIGVTNDVVNRVLQHKQKQFNSFSARYNCNKLVHYETFQWIDDAIKREKQLKAGSRQKKMILLF
ncbi:MAG TPA: GIY-YIG nuclease family protein [Mucilaginibacter sp.]